MLSESRFLKVNQVDPISGALSESTTEMNFKNFRAGFGTTYFLNKSIGLEALLYYNTSTSEGDGAYFEDYSATNSSFNLSIGFQIYLGKKTD